MVTQIDASKYIADCDEIDGEITIYLRKPYILGGLRTAQLSEFIEDFDNDEDKCLASMYERINKEVVKISPEAWDKGIG